MNSDLPGGLHPDELGFTEPGMEQLLRALTADGTAGELAGEQAALAMFRAHVPAPASGALAPLPAGGARRAGCAHPRPACREWRRHSRRSARSGRPGCEGADSRACG